MVARRHAFVFGLALMGCLVAPPARASDDAIERAKDRFRRGVILFNANDLERALQLFLESRAAFPSVQNTSNAAICLDKLGRHDEALELYEQLLTEFPSGVPVDESRAVASAMEALRKRVGSVWLSADVAGASVVIDGRARGTLPLVVPIRVLPGRRLVRVIKDGYITHEASLDVAPAGEAKLEVRLRPLADAGLLRIEDPSPGAELFIDGARVGVTPWEGTLGPGRHVVWITKGDEGTAPKEVVVVQGQKAVVAMAAKPLGHPLALEVEPATATLAIDGVEVGRGRWRGRLPLGEHRVSAAEDGYRTATETVRSSAEPVATAALRLAVDPSHPRWPRAATGTVELQLVNGYALSPHLGSDAETGCSRCPSGVLAHGFVSGMRVGYRFPAGVSLAVMGGYLRLETSFERTLPAEAPPSAHPELTYDLTDRMRIEAPLGAFGVGYRRLLTERFALGGHAMVGAAMSVASDALEVTLRSKGMTQPGVVLTAEPEARSGVVLAEADLAGTFRFGAWDLGLSVAFLGLFLDGPLLERRTVAVPYVAGCTAGQLECVASGAPLPDERAHRNLLVVSPQLLVGRSF
jgi:hypothetical protein